MMTGEKEYRHKEFGLTITIERDFQTIRFYKKTWVPMWLWKLLSTPDYIDLCGAAMQRASLKQNEDLSKKVSDGT